MAVTPAAPLTTLAAWKALRAHADAIRDVHLRTLFADDAGRAGRFTVEAAGLHLDYSKNRITSDTIDLLLRLALFIIQRFIVFLGQLDFLIFQTL